MEKKVVYRGTKPLLCINTTITDSEMTKDGKKEIKSDNLLNFLTTATYTILRNQITPVNIFRNPEMTDATVVDVEQEYAFIEYTYIHRTMENYIIALSSALRDLSLDLLKELKPNIELGNKTIHLIDSTLRQQVTEAIVKQDMIGDLNDMSRAYKRITSLQHTNLKDVHYLNGALCNGVFWKSEFRYKFIIEDRLLDGYTFNFEVRPIIAPLFSTRFAVDGEEESYLTFMAKYGKLANGTCKGFGEVVVNDVTVDHVSQGEVTTPNQSSLYKMINSFLDSNYEHKMNLFPIAGGYRFNEDGELK